MSGRGGWGGSVNSPWNLLPAAPYLQFLNIMPWPPRASLCLGQALMQGLQGDSTLSAYRHWMLPAYALLYTGGQSNGQWTSNKSNVLWCGWAHKVLQCCHAKWARIHYWRTWAHSAMCWWGMVWIVVHFSPHSVHQLTLLLPCLNPRSHVSDHLARHYEAWSIIPIIFQMNSRLQPTHSDREIWLSMLESWPLLPRRTRYDCCMCCCDKCIGAPLKVHRV